MLKFLSIGLLTTSALALPSSLGSNECTWGPSHYCKEEAIAKRCNTEQVCLQRKLGYAAIVPVIREKEPEAQAAFMGFDFGNIDPIQMPDLPKTGGGLTPHIAEVGLPNLPNSNLNLGDLLGNNGNNGNAEWGDEW